MLNYVLSNNLEKRIGPRVQSCSRILVSSCSSRWVISAWPSRSFPSMRDSMATRPDSQGPARQVARPAKVPSVAPSAGHYRHKCCPRSRAARAVAFQIGRCVPTACAALPIAQRPRQANKHQYARSAPVPLRTPPELKFLLTGFTEAARALLDRKTARRGIHADPRWETESCKTLLASAAHFMDTARLNWRCLGGWCAKGSHACPSRCIRSCSVFQDRWPG